MIQDLKVYQYKAQSPIESRTGGQSFVLKTCQRSITVSFRAVSQASEPEYFEGREAYRHLLEIICGLQSKLLGENEILGQFKKAYQQFCDHSETPNPLLLKLLQKLLGYAKTIRAKHLSHLGIQTYAGIARQMIKHKTPNSPVLVLGSGELAESFIRINDPKRLYVAGRNTQKIAQLADQFGIQAADYQDPQLLQKFPVIYNTLGSEASIWSGPGLEDWLSRPTTERLLIDLAKPSMLPSGLEKAVGIATLENIFEWGEQLDNQKKDQIMQARAEILECVQRRANNFTSTFPFGWEELRLA